MDSDEPLQPISSNSPIPIVLIKITQYTVTISPVSPEIRGQKIRSAYEVLYREKWITTAERKNDMEKQEQEERKHIEALDRKIERLTENRDGKTGVV